MVVGSRSEDRKGMQSLQGLHPLLAGDTQRLLPPPTTAGRMGRPKLAFPLIRDINRAQLIHSPHQQAGCSSLTHPVPGSQQRRHSPHIKITDTSTMSSARHFEAQTDQFVPTRIGRLTSAEGEDITPGSEAFLPVLHQPHFIHPTMETGCTAAF